MKLKRTKRGIYLLAVLALLFIVPSAFAFDGREADSLVIEEDEVLTEDLYFAGDSLIVNGTIEGDLFFIGDSLRVNGTIEGDVIGAANVVQIHGTVEDDLMVGGSAIIVADGATLAGDLIGGGYGVAVLEGATVGGDVLAGGEGILIEGTVGGDFFGGATGIEISGSVGGNVDIGVGSAANANPVDPTLFNPNFPANTPRVAPGLVVAEGAIGGNLNYSAINPIDVSASAVEGDLSFNQTEIEAQPSMGAQFGQSLWQGVQRAAVVVLLGAIMLHFAPAMVQRPTAAFNRDMGKGILFGSLTYFLWIPAILIAVVLLFLLGSFFGLLSLNSISAIVVTIGLVLLSLDVTVILLTLAFAANIWVGFLVGNAVMKNVERPIIPLAVGSIVVVLLGSVPFVGWLIRMAVGIAGLGMLWLWWRTRNDTFEKTPDALLA